MCWIALRAVIREAFGWLALEDQRVVAAQLQMELRVMEEEPVGDGGMTGADNRNALRMRHREIRARLEVAWEHVRPRGMRAGDDQ